MPLSVVLTDVLTGQPVTYQASSLFTVDTGADCTGGDAEDDDAAGADETDDNGASESFRDGFGDVPDRAGRCRQGDALPCDDQLGVANRAPRQRVRRIPAHPLHAARAAACTASA